jgi:hypothetical protein
MKILPINNIQNNRQQNFKAKFSKQDVKHFLKEIEGNDVDIVPKLYTMLDFVKTIPGDEIKILSSSYRPWYQIQIDGKSATQGRYYINAYHALQDITVQSKDSPKKVLSVEKMTKETFWENFYKNSTKTIEDIENLFA